ncbi:glycosyltransferase family 4 protein [Aeromonas sp. AE23HZ002T15]
MIKVAMLVPSLRNVGPIRVAYDLITEVLRKRSQYFYFEIFYFDPVGDVIFPCKSTKLNVINFYKLYSFDIVHSHMIRPDLINALLFLHRGKRLSTIHNIVETDLFYSHGKTVSFIFSRAWKYVWMLLDKKVVLTDVAKEYYIKKFSFPSQSVHVVNNGVEQIKKPDSFDPEIFDVVTSFKRKGYSVLGSVALFNDRKGLEQVIELLAIEREFSYIVIGDGPSLDKLKNKAKQLGVSDRVFFSGFKNDGKKNIFLFDCYVMPSREEGFPLALTEAISTGVVTVCSDIAVFKEILDVKSTSYFQLDNIESMASAVHYALNNMTAISHHAMSKYLQGYTREIMAEHYVKIYNEI